MIWKATFIGRNNAPLRETVYAAEDLDEAIELLANGTVDVPPTAIELKLELHDDEV